MIETIISILRFMPLAGIVALLLIGVMWRAWLQRRRYGAWGIIRFSVKERAQAARVGAIALPFAVLAGQAFDAAMRPVSVHLQTWPSPQIALILSIVGAIVLVGGLALLVAAQLQMGASWRIGIDESAAPGLIDTGLFRFCRNPIYLALLVIVTGYVVLLPTLWSLFSWCAAYLLVRLQIAAEESYLQLSYGEAYETYARRVSRLLPCFGGT